MKSKLLFTSVLFALSVNQISAQYIRTQFSPNAIGVSNQGLVSLYNSPGSYYIWNPDTQDIENIGGIAPGNGYGGVAVFSADGRYLSGTASDENPNGTGLKAQMSRYDSETKTWKVLGFTGMGSDPNSMSSGYYISADGKTVGGLSYNSNGNKKSVGFVWNEDKGPIELTSSNPTKNARINAISGDGSIVAGYQDIGGPWKSSVWKRKADGTYETNKMLLINPNGSATDNYNQLGEVRAISPDGKWIGGKSDFAFPNAWIWSEATGVKDLGTLTNEAGRTGWVTAFNNDASIVMGYYIEKKDVDSPAIYYPFIWTQKDGIKDLNDFVQNTLGYDMGGDKIYVPLMISPNGKYISGWAFPSNLSEQLRSFRIQLPDSYLATQNIAVKSDVKLYPNPVTDVLNIETKDKVESVKIYNASGQLVNQSKVDADKKVNVASLTTGVYNVNVTTDKGSQSHKVIKK
ncbi:Por secretion system C-terminal sorting domain-containing protein [Soonwooa buanensis]|uniref:Por secretion system C-terminal sorting domain-containing protein n=1 Tax=Soonwooa buanensis TaxID=619805 RepID=A0A1T5FKU1_9FLAO|nr:T9SS type A sorting domain-containing protein [Soonwooa buanensis]SKB96844.1 Por secretion system C-terminal sorting domain-containing protein [Soonwooa buanensis]